MIAVILRCYNDGIDDARRQDLYRYAADVVGTRTRADRGRRARLASEFFGVDQSRLGRFKSRSWRLSTARAALRYGKDADEQSHRAFLCLVDEVLETAAPAAPHLERRGPSRGRGPAAGRRRPAAAD